MGVPVLNSLESMVAAKLRQYCRVLMQAVDLSQREMVERAKSLAIDHNRLESTNEQRHKVAQSELLDHAGLAAVWRMPFAPGGDIGCSSKTGLQMQKSKRGLRPADMKIELHSHL